MPRHTLGPPPPHQFPVVQSSFETASSPLKQGHDTSLLAAFRPTHSKPDLRAHTAKAAPPPPTPHMPHVTLPQL